MYVCADIHTYPGLPEVTVTPSSKTVEVSYAAKFVANVKGVGTKNFRYMWFHSGKVLSNENDSMLIINYVKKRNKGIYYCRIINIYNDSAVSNRVRLTVRSKFSIYFSLKYVHM